MLTAVGLDAMLRRTKQVHEYLNLTGFHVTGLSRCPS